MESVIVLRWLLLLLLLLLNINFGGSLEYKKIGCTNSFDLNDFLAKPVNTTGAINVTDACYRNCSQLQYPYFEVHDRLQCVCSTVSRIYDTHRGKFDSCPSRKYHHFVIYQDWMQNIKHYMNNDQFCARAHSQNRQFSFMSTTIIRSWQFVDNYLLVVLTLGRSYEISSIGFQANDDDHHSVALGTEIWVSSADIQFNQSFCNGRGFAQTFHDVQRTADKFHLCGNLTGNFYFYYQWNIFNCNKQARTILVRKFSGSGEIFLANLHLFKGENSRSHLVSPKLLKISHLKLNTFLVNFNQKFIKEFSVHFIKLFVPKSKYDLEIVKDFTARISVANSNTVYFNGVLVENFIQIADAPEYKDSDHYYFSINLNEAQNNGSVSTTTETTHKVIATSPTLSLEITNGPTKMPARTISKNYQQSTPEIETTEADSTDSTKMATTAGRNKLIASTHEIVTTGADTTLTSKFVKMETTNEGEDSQSGNKTDATGKMPPAQLVFSTSTIMIAAILICLFLLGTAFVTCVDRFCCCCWRRGQRVKSFDFNDFQPLPDQEKFVSQEKLPDKHQAFCLDDENLAENKIAQMPE